jgi:hypothetical protein
VRGLTPNLVTYRTLMDVRPPAGNAIKLDVLDLTCGRRLLILACHVETMCTGRRVSLHIFCIVGTNFPENDVLI